VISDKTTSSVTASGNHSDEPISSFYLKHLQPKKVEQTSFIADCPFCAKKGMDPSSKLIVFLNKEGFFHGYFRCLNRCVPGGFPLWFGRLAAIDPADIPGFDPDREPFLLGADFPVKNMNNEIKRYSERMTGTLKRYFKAAGISSAVLAELQIGYNGRYLVYPYFQEDSNCYSARCVFPEKVEDYFWHGNEQFFNDQYRLFNVEDIGRCENGALFICEGEDNLLTLKQLGFPGICVPDSQTLEKIDPERFSFLHTIFMVMVNSSESEAAARSVASRLGYKVRIFKWATGLPRKYDLYQLACEKKKQFSTAVSKMIQSSRAFSPFATPVKEKIRFFNTLVMESSSSYEAMKSGFAGFDEALEGIHGINVIGGAPKVGKSCFMIHVATELAATRVPVLYYDFENGRQKIYHRTLSRLTRFTTNKLKTEIVDLQEQERYDKGCRQLDRMLHYFRVINDRKVSPEIMRRHIDFIRHETRCDYTMVVIDSLHKLPFKDFSERRTGIDAWLRQLESIRDELQVSFMVISELSRGAEGSYDEAPHLGIFKGSGDIEYSADNAMVLLPKWDQLTSVTEEERINELWLVASREHSPGLIGRYRLDYPYWGFEEL